MDKGKVDKLIVSDPSICHGQPVFKGTRLMVWQVVEMLEAGETEEEILKGYTNLPRGFKEAALLYSDRS